MRARHLERPLDCGPLSSLVVPTRELDKIPESAECIHQPCRRIRQPAGGAQHEDEHTGTSAGVTRMPRIHARELTDLHLNEDPGLTQHRMNTLVQMPESRMLWIVVRDSPGPCASA